MARPYDVEFEEDYVSDTLQMRADPERLTADGHVSCASVLVSSVTREASQPGQAKAL